MGKSYRNPFVTTNKVQHAFGDFFGFVNAYTNLINSLASQAILVVLFVDYVSTGAHFTTAEVWGLRLGFVGIVTLINIKGLLETVHTSTF